jgi:NAD(P)-dependent dehydrogenase (short-subunit alcohol dehydrogenase family)
MPHTTKDLFDLTGKVAIVTGASRGIGLAIARGLAEFGAKVVLSSRKQDMLDSAAKSLLDAGLEASAVAAHVGDAESIRNLVEKTKSLYGGVDVLVNNAATNPVFGPLLDSDEAAFDKIVAVNVKGPLLLAKQVHPVMVQRGGGSIINIGSIAGLRPEPMLGLYSVTKAALESLTKVMAREWGSDGIRVNLICPGLVKTRFSAALWQDEARLKEALDTCAIRRIGQPEDVVGLAVYLASPASSYSTGGVFVVDGGSTI